MRVRMVRCFGVFVLWLVGVCLGSVPMPVHSSEPEAVPVETRVKKATVFPSMARIERAGSVALSSKGPVRVDLVGLSQHANQETFQFGGSGTARVRVLGTALERVFATGEIDEEVRKLSEKLEELQREDRALIDEIDAARAERKFVESLVSTYAKDSSSNLALKRMNVGDWAKAGEFVRGGISRLAAKIRDFDKKRAELKKEIETLQTQLNQLRSKKGRWTTVAHVDLDVLKPGRFELTAVYLLPQARWSMVYDARVFPDKGDVEVGVYATVAQNTGTDWEDVELVLSTARPAVGGTIPELYPRYVNVQPPMRDRRKSAARSAPAMAESASMDGLAVAGGAFDEDAAEEEIYRANMAQATVDTVGLATFTAPSKSRIPSDNQIHKIFLLSKVWQAATHYEAAPELSPHAYLAAKTENRFDFPMLAGLMNLFIEDDYVGRANLQTTQAGEELVLPFGVDERVRVERRLLNRKRSESGVFDKSTRIHYRYLIKVTNTYSSKAVSVKLHERLPVSQNEKIKVELGEKTTKGYEKDREKPGVLTWELELPKGKSREITLEYIIEHPKDWAIYGAP